MLGLAPPGQLVPITPQQNKLHVERFFFFISSNSPLPPLHKYTENKWNHPTNISLTSWAPSSLPSFPHCFVLSYFRHLILLPPSLPSNVLPPVSLQDPFRHLAPPTEEACYFPRSLIASLQSAASGSCPFVSTHTSNGSRVTHGKGYAFPIYTALAMHKSGGDIRTSAAQLPTLHTALLSVLVPVAELNYCDFRS